MDRIEVIQKLNQSLYVKSKISHYLLAAISPIKRDSLSVLVFPEERDIEKYFTAINITDVENYEITRVGSIYDQMRNFADLGYAGMISVENSFINFANRISDYDISLPSLGKILIMGNRESIFFGASGRIDPLPAISTWLDYQKTDKLLRKFVKFHTGFQIDPQKTFYTFIRRNRTNELFLLLNGSPLHGPYSYSEGYLAVFSEINIAAEYKEKLQKKEDIDIVEIDNLYEYLTNQFAKHFPFVLVIGLNPGGSRPEQGYFFMWNDMCVLRNVFGYYQINHHNEIAALPDGEILGHTDDTVDKPGSIDSASLNLFTTINYPLGRVTGNTHSPFHIDEAIDVVEKEIQSSKFKDTYSWDSDIELNDIGINSYLVFGFDKISGTFFSNNGLDPTPYIFKDIFEACSFFYHRLFEKDHQIRLEGYAICGVFKKGSNDEILENYLLEQKRKGIKNLMRDILCNGYKPEFSQYLQQLINNHSPVLQIETCGYLSDLANYNDPIFLENLDDYLEESEFPIYRRLNKLWNSARYRNIPKNPVWDSKNNQLKILLGKTYDKVSKETKLMLLTAITEYESAGIDPLYDYAGISMKLCKVFERELRMLVFDSWFDKNTNQRMRELVFENTDESADPEDFTLSLTFDWIKGKGKLTLGNMKYIIRRIRDNANHVVLKELNGHIETLPSRQFILSEEMQALIGTVSSRYRNGGVHEYMVTYEICSEALDTILFGQESAINKMFSG